MQISLKVKQGKISTNSWMALMIDLQIKFHINKNGASYVKISF